MQYVMHARGSDWHIKVDGSNLWACGKTIGDALRSMRRNAISHDVWDGVMVVQWDMKDENGWTRRCLEQPRLIASTGRAREVVLPDGYSDRTYYILRNPYDGNAELIAGCWPGFYPASTDTALPQMAERVEYEMLEAFGVPQAEILPTRWIGYTPRLIEA